MGQTEESSRLVTVQYSDPLGEVLSLFSEHGAHRVLVSNSDKKNDPLHPPVLLSQMDIVRYLQAHNHHLGSILDVTVPDLVARSCARREKRLGEAARRMEQEHHHQVPTVTFKTTAMKTFEQIAHDPSISALPIVDDEDCLVADIGPQDLRGLNKARLQELTKPVLMFLKSKHGDLIAPFTCHERFTLSQIMAAFVLRKAYRLWWVDQDGHIQGVITMTDVLGSFLDPSFF
jgi:CBS-domain-containing membrane protein